MSKIKYQQKKETKKFIPIIRYSFPLIFTARCKYCQGGPYFTYSVRNYRKFLNPQELKKENCLADWYDVSKYIHCTRAGYSPNECITLNYFTCSVSQQKFNTKLHKNKYVPQYNQYRDFSEFLSCACGLTIWSYCSAADFRRLEIKAKRSYKIYPCIIK